MKRSKVARVMVAAVVLSSVVVGAADRTWNGGGTDSFWGTAANWGGTAPSGGDALFFGGTARLNNTNNLLAETALGGITFNSGAGTFVITGAVAVLEGDVVNSDDSLQTLNLPLALSGVRTFNTASTGNLTVNGVLSGSGGLVKAGAQTLTLSGVNTFTGGVTVSGGTLKVTSAINNGGVAGSLGQATADAANIVIDGGTLEVNTGSASSDRGITFGLSGGTLYYNGNANSTTLTLTGPLALSGSGPHTITLLVPANLRTLNWNAAIGDSGGGPTALAVLNTTSSGSSGVSLSGPMSFSGGLSVGNATQAGTLTLGTASPGFSGGVTVHPSSRLNIEGGTVPHDIVNNGTLGVSGQNLTVAYSGLITGAGGFNMGANSLTLTRTDNSYTGSTVFSGNVGGHVLQVSKLADGGQNSSIGASGAAAGNLLFGMNNGGTFTVRYVGTGDTTDRLFTDQTGNGTMIVENNGTGPLQFTNTGSIPFGTQLNRDNVFRFAGSYVGEASTFAPAITNNGTGTTRIEKTGTGLWALTGNNTYSGLTTVGEGTLRLVGASSLGSGNLRVDPSSYNYVAVVESDFDLVRPGGTGSGEMRVAGAQNTSIPGFSAKGNDINVCFGTLLAPTALTWNVAPFVPNSSTLILNAATADSKLTFRNPIDLNNTASAATRTFRVDAATAAINGALTKSGAGAAHVAKAGAGKLILSGNNIVNDLTVSAGALEMTGDNTLGNIAVNAGSLAMTGINSLSNVTVSGGSAVLDGTNGLYNVTVSGGALALAGSYTLTNVTLSGTGQLTLSGDAFPAGTTALSGGTLTLDYTEENNNKLDPAKGLTFAPGNFGSVGLRLIGNAATPFTQTVSGLTLTRGAYDTVDIVSGQASLSLGAVSRSAVVNMASSPGTVNATPVLQIRNNGSGTTVATTTGSGGALFTAASGAAYATVNGDWAAKDAGNANLVAGAGIGGFYAANTWSAGNNTDVIGSHAPAAGATTASLRFNTAAAATVTLSGANTITSGGILVTPNVGANTSRITGGSLAAGSGAKEVVVIQNNTNGVLQIDSTITGVGYALTKAGLGTLTLTAQNTFSGGYFINQGALQFGDGSTSGTLDQTAGASRCGDVVATGDTTLRVAAGASALTNIVYRLTLGGANGAAMTLAVDANAVLQFKNGLGSINAGGTNPYWIKTGAGTLQNLGGTYGVPGWVREGLFIAAANSFNGVGPNSGNMGSTIGGTETGAPAARVELAGTIGNFDPSNNGSDILTINRTGSMDLRNHLVGSSWTMDNMRFVGGGAILSSNETPGGFTRFWSTVTYLGANANDERATLSGVSISLSNNVAFAINDSTYVETELEVSSGIGESGGSRTLTKSGAGTMRLSGSNTWSGVTTASAGILTVAKAMSLPNYNVNSKVVVSAGATLAVNAGGAGEWGAAEIDALRGTTPSPFAANAFFGIDTSGGDFAYSSLIADGGGALNFRKLGTNALTLANNNTWTGSKTVHAGTLVAGHANALGTSGAITVNSNAFLAVDTGVTFSRPVTFAAGSGLAGRGTFHAGTSWTSPTGFVFAPGLPHGTLTVELGGTARTVTLSSGSEVRVRFNGGSHGELAVNGVLNIGNPSARLVLTGTPSFGRHVLAEAVTLSGTFAEVDMTQLKPQGTILYENNQVILNAQAAGTVLLLR